MIPKLEPGQSVKQTAGIAGKRIAYYDSGGSGPVVMALHAVGHSSDDYLPMAARLGETFRVIAPDLPGHGKSDAIDESYCSAALLSFLEEFVEHLGVGPFILIGNSIGGALAIRYAHKHPDNVRHLVLCNPGGLDKGGLIGKIFIYVMAWIFKQGERGAFWFSAFYKYYYRLVLPARLARSRRAEIVADGPVKAGLLRQAWQSFGRSSEDLRSQFKEIGLPVWIAWAKKDRIIQYIRNKQSLKGKKVTFFAAGHAPFLEDPDQFAREFVDRMGSPRNGPPGFHKQIFFNFLKT